MTTTGEISVLLKLVELTKRCGLNPAAMDISLDFVGENADSERRGFFRLSFIHNYEPEDTDKADLMLKLLGVPEDADVFKTEHLEEMDRAVDAALDLAPRARVR